MSSTKSGFCPCGKVLHYTDPSIERIVQSMVERLGEFIQVTVNGRVWNVSRHYIALHGLIGKELPNLGFEEITPEVPTPERPEWFQ